MKLFSSPSQKIGEIGEKSVIKYLNNHNFKIIERNWTKKCGELDIIAKKDEVLHFIEVKSIKFHMKQNLQKNDCFRPEENLTSHKIQRLKKTIELYWNYSEKKGIKIEEWQFDLFCVYLDAENNVIKIEIFEDLII